MNEEHTLSLEELGEIKKVKVYNQAYVDKQQERIEALEKENAELKKQLEMSDKVYNDNLDYSYHIEGQLTKAKEILKKFSEFVNIEVAYIPEHTQEIADKWNELCEQTEQFLKEVAE